MASFDGKSDHSLPALTSDMNDKALSMEYARGQKYDPFGGY
jgi:hypothetical protein